MRYRVPPGSRRTVVVAWLNARTPAPTLVADESTYAAARRALIGYWRERLAPGLSLSVPDAAVGDAQLASLVQDLTLTWRYSVGNPHQEFSFPESVDVARVLAEEGFADVAESILRTSLTRKPLPYPNWKSGQRLVAIAEIYRLTRDAAFVREVTPALRRYVDSFARQVAGSPTGLLARERYSSDIARSVLGLHSQAMVWEGLRAMAAVWATTGEVRLATTCRRVAARLECGLRAAVHASERRLADGSLFVPVAIALLDSERPYAALTRERLGSYWNLVTPYALASGFFRAGGAEARGVLGYMARHGSRLLGLVRAGAYALYGRNRPSAAVAPLGRQRGRAMYLPPNAAANATFLETLRLTLVDETRDRAGAAEGVRLAFATPRSWLLPGGTIAVRNAPTSFGPVSFSIASGSRRLAISVTEPAWSRPRTLALRLRLPASARLLGVDLDGHPYHRFDPRTGTIRLPVRRGVVTLVARRTAP